MGKRRRLSSHKTKHVEKEIPREIDRTFDDSAFENHDSEIPEPDINIEEEEKDEVGEARFRFYGALKGLTDKKANEDSTSESSLFDEEEHDEEDMFSDSQINIVQDKVRHELARKYLDSRESLGHNTSLSATKYVLDASDSRDESKLSVDGQITKQSYVMKLFDRSVDLAQFDDATPLYPICRSWVANQPKKPWEKKKEIPPVPTWNIKEESTEEETEAEKKPVKEDIDPEDVDMSEIEPSQIELKVIAKLPPPTYYVDINAPSVRIPQPMPKYIDEVNALLPDESKAPSSPGSTDLFANVIELPTKEDLMGGHLGRWSLIKRSWLHASQKNEERYLKSRKLLQLMYNRSQK
uniref:Protein lin-37 homolog n=2 Tax=Cacopsylla melanoneura TaxID=428564 RepID=A0A8D8Q9H3_9HEMI